MDTKVTNDLAPMQNDVKTELQALLHTMRTQEAEGRTGVDPAGFIEEIIDFGTQVVSRGGQAKLTKALTDLLRSDKEDEVACSIMVINKLNLRDALEGLLALKATVQADPGKLKAATKQALDNAITKLNI